MDKENRVSFGSEFFDWVMTFIIVAILSVACNMVAMEECFWNPYRGCLSLLPSAWPGSR